MIATIFFPAARTGGTAFNASRRCEFAADRFAQRTFDDMIQSIRRERLAAQYLSGSYTAYDFVHMTEFERMIHSDLTSQFSQPFH